MTHEEETAEERLKAVAYQFMMLYESWAEDHQKSAKQNDKLAQLAKYFSKSLFKIFLCFGIIFGIKNHIKRIFYAQTLPKRYQQKAI